MAFQHEHSVYLKIGSTELEAIVGYTVTPGWAGDYTDPGYPAEVEIQSVEIAHETAGNPFLGRKPVRRTEPASPLLTEIIKADPDINADLIEAAGQ